ncbi:MAG: HNH endonuclease [Acidimicrobiia bacterium]
MTRSSREEMAALREEVFARDGWHCVWPGCDYDQALELAHLEPKGMGGRTSVNRVDNLICLCRFHHDLIDGRSHFGLKREMIVLLKAWMEGR